MIVRPRPLLALLSTTALCAVLLVPTQLGDGRLPRWMNVFADVKEGVRHITESLRHVHVQWPAIAPWTRTAAVTPRAPPPPQPGSRLDKPQAIQDAAILKQAYANALADERIRALGYDPSGILDAISAYRADNLSGGDAAVQKIGNSVVRAALEWVALRNVPQSIDLNRLNAFSTAHPDWPAPTWFRHQAEARLLRVQDPKVVEAFFATRPPETTIGKFALAKALKSDGRGADATKLARAIYREGEIPSFIEGKFKSEFGADLNKSDHKYRADRLLYNEQIGPALRAAALAGPDVVALAKARAAVIAEAPSDKAIADVPATLRNDPGLILAEVQKLRREDKLGEAAKLMQTAPKDASQLIDGDEWWTERRVLARRLLDAGNPVAAYIICATPAAVSTEAKIEAQFHAGWIALRFMNEPPRAAYHFAVAAKLAETPTSIARIAYWQGRTVENSVDPDAMTKAHAFYAKAAVHGSTYYGQLARETIGLTTNLVHEPEREAMGDARALAVRAIELLYAAGEKDSAYALAIDAANNLKDDQQVAALATVIARQQDAHLALTIGKLIGQRGIPVDPLAFPTFGIPRYDALQNSASPPIVYSIARQESAFLPMVVSKAGAKGLMQMIDSTAKSTATKAGLPFDGHRLLTDASFNVQLGAAHLGALLAEQGGSYILTFAAYNAGGGRVKQWIDTYGDPRSPGVDPIDWVERIPFTETRNYVQRVMANVAMYQAIFAEQSKSADAKTAREAKL